MTKFFKHDKGVIGINSIAAVNYYGGNANSRPAQPPKYLVSLKHVHSSPVSSPQIWLSIEAGQTLLRHLETNPCTN